MLRLEGISKRYENANGAKVALDGVTKVALDGVTLEVGRGQMVGVFGPSGCGKTTLLRIAAGLLTPDDGYVLYDGERLDEMPSNERMRLRRREIACVGKEPTQERLSVLDHVAMPLLIDRRDHRSAQRRAREALLACEAERCAGMELSDLSDGERQRVTIARALVIEPKLLLADGPAASLSLPEQESIMALLSSLAREARVAVLVADSDAEALIRADPILYLSGGRLIDSTPPQDRDDPPGGSDRPGGADLPGDAGAGDPEGVGGNVVKLPVRPRHAAADA